MKNKNILLHVALLLLFAALIGGMYPLVKIAEQTITPLTLGMLRAALAALVLLFVVGFVMKRNLAPLISQWATYATLGVLLSLFFLAIPEAEERISASLSALLSCFIPIGTFLIATLGYFIPIFAILASHFLVGDSIGWLQLVGLGMTLVGAWLVNRSPQTTGDNSNGMESVA